MIRPDDDTIIGFAVPQVIGLQKQSQLFRQKILFVTHLGKNGNG